MAELTQENLKTMLEGFRNDVSGVIEAKSKEQTDKANAEIATLKTELAQANTAIVELKKASEKSFGLPGIETEKGRWSWAKYFTGLYKDHQANKGLISPSEAKNYWDGAASFEARVCRDYTAGDGSSGGFLVPPQIYQGDIVDTVYANTAILKLPITKFTGLKGDMPIPVDNGNLSAYHLGETEAPTKTSASYKLEWLRPKKVGVYVRVSNRLLDQTNMAMESIIRNKMTLDASVELARGLTNGKGADSEGKGIMQYYGQMTGTKNIAANGARFGIDDLASMKQALAAANELRDTNTNGTIMHPSVLWGMLRERTEMYSSQAAKKGQPSIGTLLIDQTTIESALKGKIESTTQIAATDTVGNSITCSKVVTGDWSKFIYASFRDPIFRISDVASDSTASAFLRDETYVVMFLEYDCVCTRPSAFCGRGGAETLETSW